MQAPIFKKGDRVKFTSVAHPRGRGHVAHIKKTSKGVWYTVAAADGATITLRAASLRAA